MDTELLQTMALVAVIAAALIFAFIHLFEWIAWKIEQAKLQAREEELRRSQRDEELSTHEAVLELRQSQQRLIAKGMLLLSGGGERQLSYTDIQNIYGLIGKVEKELKKHARQCFQTLVAVAGVYGFGPASFDLADQDAVRKDAQENVLAIVAAASQQLDAFKNLQMVDAALFIWQSSLHHIGSMTCPCCPVVDDPKAYPRECPVMEMMNKKKGKTVYAQPADQHSNEVR
jgi:hypothetical protein